MYRFVIAAALAAAGGAGFAEPAIAADPTPVTVEIHDYHFMPETLTVTAGTKVVWVNQDGSPHTITDKARSFRSAALDKDDSYSFTFGTPGEFTYFCTLHPMMVGKVVVKPAG